MNLILLMEQYKIQEIFFLFNYVDNEITFDLPEQNSGYILDTENSNCTNGVIPNWNHSTWEFEGDYTNYDSSTNKQTKCSLYFVKTKTVETVLGELEVYEYTPDFTKSACDDEVCESHEKVERVIITEEVLRIIMYTLPIIIGE